MQWSVGYPLVPFQMPRLNLNLKMVEWNSALSVAQGLKTNFSTKYMSYDPNKRMIQENFSSMDPRKTVRITLSLGPYHSFLYVSPSFFGLVGQSYSFFLGLSYSLCL